MLSDQIKMLLLASGFALTINNAKAVEVINGEYQWQFGSGLPWPGGYDQNTGKPDNLIYARDEYPGDFFDRIANALPEAHVNESFLTGDAGSNITLTETAEVFVTFIHEGAGYKNAFGFFTYDAENPPTSIYDVQETIIFPNLSYPHLTNGHRINIGEFPAGTTIGFFIAANGFWYDTGVKPFAVPYYYSLKDLNPDPTDALRQHNVLLYDAEVQEVILGFEDLPRSWGDNDFNDAVFSVKTTPGTAIASEKITPVPDANDTDADGVLDSDDAFPNDYTRAFSSFYPSSQDWVTLAFEDNWPQLGDYDMNDLVIRERLQTTYNSAGDITGFILHGFIDARGGAFHNGFALRLLNTTPSLLDEATLSIDGTIITRIAESWQENLVIRLWNDSHVYTDTGESGSCSHFNTKTDCNEFDPVPFTLDIKFAEYPESLNHSSFDFFIFRSDYRGREIHLANYPPTDLFDLSQLGRFDDTSSTSTGRYFKSAQNLPWALRVDSNWCYPREYIDVLWAYPDYEQWVESAGDYAQNWFHASDRIHHYRCRDDNRFEPELGQLPGSSPQQLECNVVAFSANTQGVQLDVSITNIGTDPVAHWQTTLTFTSEPVVLESWGATVTTEDLQLVARDLTWNGWLDAGDSHSFGVQLSALEDNTPPTCTAQ